MSGGWQSRRLTITADCGGSGIEGQRGFEMAGGFIKPALQVSLFASLFERNDGLRDVVGGLPVVGDLGLGRTILVGLFK